MSSAVDWEGRNFQALMLNQAMLGAITPNFRMVVLSRKDDEWVIKFFLEADVQDDCDEVEDIMCQFSAYQDFDLKYKWEVLIGNEALPKISQDEMMVFRRKEYFD